MITTLYLIQLFLITFILCVMKVLNNFD